MSDHKRTSNDLSDLLEAVSEDRAESAGERPVYGLIGVTKMHLLMELLLCDKLDFAITRIAIETAAARPDVVLGEGALYKLTQGNWMEIREKCLTIARRLHRDERNLDLYWLMAAAVPGKPWTYGFFDRLANEFREMEASIGPIEGALLKLAAERFEHWRQMADGFPSVLLDPFHAVTDRGLAKSHAAQRSRDEKDRAAAATAAVAAERLYERAKRLEDARVDSDEYGNDPDADQTGVQVISGDAKLLAPYKALRDGRTDVTMTPDLRQVREILRNEFPHAQAAIDLMLVDLRPEEEMRFRPFVLVGNPGCGKSRLIRRLAELLSASIRRYDGAGSSDNAFGGTPKRWSTATPCFPLLAIAETRRANPILMIDEIDKAGTSTHNGSLLRSMMPFLEQETSRSYPDPGLETEVNLSHVNYAATANDDAGLPKPLKDRLRVIRVPSPGPMQLALLVRSILIDLAEEFNVPRAFMAPLAGDEMDVVRRAWGDNGSIRQLQKIVRGTVTARDQHASRH